MNSQNEFFINAKRFEGQGRFDLAAQQYEKAIKLGVGDQAIAHQRRGRSLARMERLEEALEECQMALNLNPDLHLAHSVSGYIYGQQGKYDAAEEELLTALDLQPGDVVTLTNLVNLYSVLERYQEETTMCERVIQYQPENLEMRNILVHLYLSQARFREAIKQLNEAHAARPGDLGVYPYYAAAIVDAVPHYLRLNPAVGAAILVGSFLLAPFGPPLLSLPIGIALSAFVLVSAFVYLWFYISRFKGKGFVILQVLVFYLLLCAVYWGIVYIRNFR